MQAQKEEIGHRLFRWHVPGRDATSCLITAHGGKAWSLHNTMGLGHTDVQLHYYSAHGHPTTDIGLGPFMQGQGTIFETLNPDTSPDYLLQKYTNTDAGAKGRHRHNEAGETYASVAYGAAYEDCDVITVRNRLEVSQILLSTILKQIFDLNLSYTEIHCAFCRGRRS